MVHGLPLRTKVKELVSVNQPTHPRIAVLGPGAIGTTVAAALHEVGRTPLLCGRTPRDSLTLHGSGLRIVVPGPVRTDPAQVEGPADLIFLAVKATQTASVAHLLAALIGPQTLVCGLQNGV
jgi:2-dehydropantoate 2-reductase